MDFQYPHKYIKLEHNREIFKEFFVINWTLNNVCNFSCSYCTPNLYDGSIKSLPLETLTQFIDKIFLEKKDKKIFFEFTGGEITYHPNLIELFTYIKDHNGFTGIISNGSQKIDWWQKNKFLIDHACLSFHSEKGKTEHFYEVVKELYGVVTLHLNFMMLPEKFGEIYDLAKKIANDFEGISISIQPLFQNFSGPMFNYSEEQLKILENPNLIDTEKFKYNLPKTFKNKIFRGEMRKVFPDGTTEIANPTLLISNQQNKWLGWNCNIGVENLVVDPVGNIARGVCFVGGFIGNIKDLNFQLPTEGIVCSRKKCTCAFDIMCSKAT